MKAHKIHPEPITTGYHRAALIELSYDELFGMYELIMGVLGEAQQDKTILLSFENSNVTNASNIFCIYEEDESDE